MRKRERMAQIREEIAVQKAKETELNKTIHITGLTTQTKFSSKNFIPTRFGSKNDYYSPFK